MIAGVAVYSMLDGGIRKVADETESRRLIVAITERGDSPESQSAWDAIRAAGADSVPS